MKNKKFVAITLLLVVLASITSTITPVIIQILSSRKTEADTDIFGMVIAAMFISFVLQFALLIYRQNYAAKFNTGHLSSLLHKMFKMNYDAYSRLEPTYLINRIFSAVDTVYLFMISSFEGLTRAGFIIFFSLFLAYSVHWSIFLCLLILIPVNFFGFRFINKRLKHKMEALQHEGATANKDLVTALSNADHIKQLPDFTFLEKALLPGIGKMYQTLANTNKFAQGASSVIDFINQLLQNLIYVTIAYSITQQRLPVGSIVIIGVVLPLFFNSLRELTQVNLNLKTLEAAIDFVKSDLDSNIEADGAVPVTTIESITFEQPEFKLGNMEFGYPLQEHISRGQVVYLRGPSGSGKSSLLKLLLKFRAGSGITINDMPIHTVSNSSLRSRIAYLAQNTAILSKSLEENIGFGERLTPEQKKIIEQSGVIGPILKLKAWDTLLTENGANLSGGEKQRIAIARMLLKDADVYILDESTSSIDQTSSDDIFNALLAMAKDKIVIYTSHDSDTVKYATGTISLEAENINDEKLLDGRGAGQGITGDHQNDQKLYEIR
ncbi:ABC transporter ATP-binding protein [Paenibacillus sp. FSL R7-0273]|uniref:ATP-binding cassette domain-containing protein n=1 Tax=Paenibacillus sp. FSL R7-0273 TaxID=1536772 RepID=UPI0018CD9ABD|nr:ABC transporter ATP-binding protein [Paenibacillus sp. FSL R7-0273]